jgi:SET family sugar efflux transporter-like MFS transporter
VIRSAAFPRAFVPLGTAVLLLGIADSMAGAYFVLFAADEVGLGPIQVGVVVSAPAVGGILLSTVLGRRFDLRPTRLYAAVAAAAGALGFALMTTTRSFVLLVLIALTLIGAAQAAFPQLFSLARVVLGHGAAGQRSAPLLRSAWSLAWALGPLIGAAVLARAGYPEIFGGAALVLALTAVVTLAVPRPPSAAPHQPAADPDEATAADPDEAPAADPDEAPAAGPDEAPAPDLDEAPARTGRIALALLTASIAAFFTAMFAGSVALPLFVTRSLHQPEAAVGVLFSACAAVEVVAALALAAIPVRVSQRLLILGGMLAFVLYFALTVAARGMPLLLVGQVARGIAIAVVGAAGIRYFQEFLAPATGRATTLFSNASTAGSLVAGILAGAAVRAFGYTSALALCGALAAVAAVLFYAGSSGRRPPPLRSERRDEKHEFSV